MTNCAYCHKKFEPAIPNQRFHSPRCKAAWHRENVPSGVVTNLRPLKRGGWSVTIKYAALPDGLHLGGSAWCESVASTGTETQAGDKSC
jgi:hypothetical protein